MTMYSGDDYYGDDVTSPLDRPAPRGAMNPWVVVYLEKQGLRTAEAHEAGWYVLVPTAGGVLKVWATDEV